MIILNTFPLSVPKTHGYQHSRAIHIVDPKELDFALRDLPAKALLCLDLHWQGELLVAVYFLWRREFKEHACTKLSLLMIPYNSYITITAFGMGKAPFTHVFVRLLGDPSNWVLASHRWRISWHGSWSWHSVWHICNRHWSWLNISILSLSVFFLISFEQTTVGRDFLCACVYFRTCLCVSLRQYTTVATVSCFPIL